MSAFLKTRVPGRNTAEIPEDRLDPSGPACAEACETSVPSWKIAENGLSFQCLSRSWVYMSGSPTVEGDLSSIARLRPGISSSQGSVLLLAPMPAESVGRSSCINKHLGSSTEKEPRFTLAYNFRGSSPWSGDLVDSGPEVGSTSWEGTQWIKCHGGDWGKWKRQGEH